MYRYEGERVGEWMSARVHVCAHANGRMGMDVYVGSAQRARACACACAGEGACACMHRCEGVREGEWVCACVHVCGYVDVHMGVDAYVGKYVSSAQRACACACACASAGARTRGWAALTCACMRRNGGVREGKWENMCVHVCVHVDTDAQAGA